MRPEVARRVVHASGTVVPGAYLVDLLTWTQVQGILLAGIVAALAVESIRLLADVELPVVRRMIRHYEEDHLAGYALYIFGGGVTGLVFDPQYAVPGILMLTLADPISGLLGDDTLRSVKPVSVLVLMFVVCLGIAWWLLEPIAAVAASVVATLSDGVKPVIKGYVIDDNLTIPIGAALAAFLVTEVLPVAL